MRKSFLIATEALFTCCAPLGFCDAPLIESVMTTSEWTCSSCRHGNPENKRDCEYCGRSK